MHQNNSLKLLLASILILCGGVVYSQPKQMSLVDCIDYALTNHPDIKVAELQLKDADWRIKESKSIGLPNINAGFDYQFQ